MSVVAEVTGKLVADTCGWQACESCAALIRFVEKWNRGEIPHSPDWEKDWLKGGSR